MPESEIFKTLFDRYLLLFEADHPFLVYFMTTSLLDEALKVIPSQQVLINVVSKRVRQLSQGHRPMVEVGARYDFGDIALREIIEGKLGWEPLTEEEIAAI